MWIFDEHMFLNCINAQNDTFNAIFQFLKQKRWMGVGVHTHISFLVLYRSVILVKNSCSTSPPPPPPYPFYTHTSFVSCFPFFFLLQDTVTGKQCACGPGRTPLTQIFSDLRLNHRRNPCTVGYASFLSATVGSDDAPQRVSYIFTTNWMFIMEYCCIMNKFVYAHMISCGPEHMH